MSTVRQDDPIASVADALQFMSYYHPKDYDGRRLVPTGHARHRHRRNERESRRARKRSLMDPVGIQALAERGPENRIHGTSRRGSDRRRGM